MTLTVHTGKTSGSNVVPSDTVVATLTTGAIYEETTTNVVNVCTESQTNSCTLSGNTPYFVVATVTGSGGQATWKYTGSFNETLVPSGNGWSIAQGWRSDYSSGAWGEWTTYATNTANDVNKVKIVAIPNLTLTATSSLTATTATLAIGNYNLAWWYKQTSGSGGTCTSVNAGVQTASLSSLTPNTEYTYSAYSDSECSTLLATAASFTTANPSLTASLTYVSGTTYTLSLTISGWTPSKDGSWLYKHQHQHQHQSADDCTSAGTNTTVSGNNNLLSGASYTYSAYSGSQCNSGNLIATAPAVAPRSRRARASSESGFLGLGDLRDWAVRPSRHGRGRSSVRRRGLLNPRAARPCPGGGGRGGSGWRIVVCYD